jgi:hypothetical protein
MKLPSEFRKLIIQSERGTMNPKIQFFMRLSFTAITLIAFVWLFLAAFIQTYQAQQNPPEFNTPFTIAATALAGLVGGIAAIGLGTTLPEKIRAQANSKISGRFKALGKQLAPAQAQDLQFIMAAFYTGLYMLAGVASWITWIGRPDVTPPLIKDLAGIVLGLAVAVVQSFFAATPSIEIRKRH